MNVEKATKLKKLRVTRVDIVDRGANYDPNTGEGSHILLYKRADGQPDTQPAKQPATKSQPSASAGHVDRPSENDNKPRRRTAATRRGNVKAEKSAEAMDVLKGVLESLTDEQLETIGLAKCAKDDGDVENSDASKDDGDVSDKAPKKRKKAPKKPFGKDDGTADENSSVGMDDGEDSDSASMSKSAEVEKAEDIEKAAIRKELDDVKKRLADETNKRETADLSVEIAKSCAHVVFEGGFEKAASHLVTLRRTAPEAAKYIESVLKAASAQLELTAKTGSLTREIGKAGNGETGSVVDRINALAKERISKSTEKMTHAQAFAMVINEDPSLYAEYVKSFRG